MSCLRAPGAAQRGHLPLRRGIAADASAEPELTADEPASKSPVLAVLIVVGMVLAGAAYWMLMPPADAPARSAEAGRPPDAPEPAPSSDAAAPVSSPEARAWDASANAKDAPKTPTPVDAPASAEASPKPFATAGSIEEMVDRVMPAVVLIEATTGRGSGFFVRHDTLITNVHVVQNDGYVTLRKSDGSTVNARVESRAPAFDIAVLKVASRRRRKP